MYIIVLPQNMAPECNLTDVIAEGIGKVHTSISETDIQYV
jgi:hypothetical protein